MARLALLFLVATATFIRDVVPAPKERERNVLIVTGTLKCGANPTNAKQTDLTLVSHHFFKNEEVEGVVEEGGKFQITMISQKKSLDPELFVFTGCNKGVNICKRKLRFAVPDSAVNSGKPYSIGEVNLETLQVKEERKCSKNNVVTVTGTLKCNGEPTNAKDTYVGLLNKRDIVADEKEIGEIKEGGKFEISLTTDSKSLHPEVHVYTECNKGNNKCKRKLRFAVPEEYVNNDGTPYSIGDVDMAQLTAQEGRERECY